ncbi:hypothetical protein SLEP1_g35110 [Rubroshorea leprosula]|uniref:AP2/ERF domain-containing protein n=1 Tax=Rubroshorea leprosula TaxID=152421 RepID=A0AAV5KMH0_9ROSI|nr:hypothetical protein SLEP1_g35110 [Rubroshorea leprosula]
METFRKSPLKPWKKGPIRGKGAPLNASCQYPVVRQRTWGKWVAEIGEPKKGTTLWLGSSATAEEVAMAYDEAARRLYGPDAYLNLPHLQPNSNSHPPNRFKWIPSKNFISMLEELKKNNGALNKSSSSSSSSSSCESETDTQIISEKSQSQSQIENLTTKEKDVDVLSTEEMLQTEEPQIDLNEFLQQLGIVREEKQSQTGGIGEIPTENLPESVMDSNIRDFEEIAAFAEKSFNWDAVVELKGIEQINKEPIPASMFMMFKRS